MWKEKCSSFEGNYYRINYRIKEATCNPKPIQKPHPVIMVGGSGGRYLLEKVLQSIKKYIYIGVTHHILHFIGLDETMLRLFGD